MPEASIVLSRVAAATGKDKRSIMPEIGVENVGKRNHVCCCYHAGICVFVVCVDWVSIFAQFVDQQKLPV